MRPTANRQRATGLIRWARRLVLLSVAGVFTIADPVKTQRVTGSSDLVVSLPPANRPEGIALSRDGQLFVGNRVVGGATVINEILRVEPDGSMAVFATLPASDAGAEGLLGLTIDPAGHVFAALASFDEHHGVWRIGPDGTPAERLRGSEHIGFPNGLTFDANGHLYVTDSFRGAIWRAARGEPFERWAERPLLTPLPSDPLGVPLPGANGIAWFAPDVLYVANTERGLIARVRIAPDGTAGPAEAVTAPFAVPTVDGIAMDVRGRIHAVLPGFTLLQASPLVRVDPDTGEAMPLVVSPVDASRFDTPVSIAFGAGTWGLRNVFVTNSDLPIVPGGPGPGVVRIDVGTAGFPIW
jgi:sugar lactone lactonase YvrE